MGFIFYLQVFYFDIFSYIKCKDNDKFKQNKLRIIKWKQKNIEINSYNEIDLKTWLSLNKSYNSYSNINSI